MIPGGGTLSDLYRRPAPSRCPHGGAPFNQNRKGPMTEINLSVGIVYEYHQQAVITISSGTIIRVVKSADEKVGQFVCDVIKAILSDEKRKAAAPIDPPIEYKSTGACIDCGQEFPRNDERSKRCRRCKDIHNKTTAAAYIRTPGAIVKKIAAKKRRLERGEKN